MIGWKSRALLGLCMGVLLSACIVRVRQVEVEPLVPGAAPISVRTPVKAHLLDGSTIVFLEGVTVALDSLQGKGMRYDVRLLPLSTVQAVPLDSVAGMENFRTGTNVPSTVALSTMGTALGALGVAALAVAIFGSCPTIYTDSAGTLLLEAESFSYSIAPLLEMRDVDRLTLHPDGAGVVRIEVRNEALETHYLNHLELLEVRRRPGETVLPDAAARVVAVAGLQPPVWAMDRAGRDVHGVLSARDGRVYETAPDHLENARVDDLRDYIDLVFPAPRGADSAAVVLRLRNSLLTTILLYDVMLGAQGARALDWLATDLAQVGSVLELGQWYNRHMGLRVEVWEDGAYRGAGRLGDSGPIAWKDVAVVVPVPAGDSLRVRLSFVTDGWRIDQVALAPAVRRPEVRTVPARRVTSGAGQLEPQALEHVLAADEQYLQTTPGQRFTLEFDTGSPDAGGERTYLLASQGYYTEWIRTGWIRTATEPVSFRPSDELLLLAIQRWRSQRASFEAQFYHTRIPVR